MEIAIHDKLSRVSTLATVAIVIVVIIAALLIGLGVWFFVERNQFLYPRYNIIGGTISTTTSIHATKGVGDTVLIANQAVGGTAASTGSIIIDASSNNAKGNFFYVFYPKNNDSGVPNPGSSVSFTIAGGSTTATFDITTFSLSPGQSAIYFLDDTNKFKYLGTTTKPS